LQVAAARETADAAQFSYRRIGGARN